MFPGSRRPSRTITDSERLLLYIIFILWESGNVKQGLNDERKNDIIKTVKYTIGTEKKEIAITNSSDFILVLAEMKLEYTLGDSFVMVVERKGSNGYEKSTVRFNITEQFIFANTGK